MSNEDLLDFPIDKDGQVKRRNIAVVVILILTFLCIVAAYILSLYKIESILFMGPAVGVFSLTLLILALALRKYYLLVPSLYGVLFVASVFLFIFLSELSPRESRQPVPVLILCLGLVYLIPFFFALRKEFRLPK